MSLWPHQQRALQELNQAIQRGAKNICITSPTGGGKSRIMFTHLVDSNCPAALYSDRKMLLSQLEKGLTKTGTPFGIRAAGYEPNKYEPVQLCMVQTEGIRSQNGRSVHRAKNIYIDEFHKNSGDTMQRLVAAHRESVADSVVIGFTATPLGIGHMADELIVAGTVSELRACGALLPAYHYGPDEPDTKWVGKVAIGEGECGLPNAKRMEFAHRVYGSVLENYHILNPEKRPTILFAPGVKESLWFAQELTASGLPSAHIDGEKIWLHGEEFENTVERRDELKGLSESGEIKIVCNRFVLREGIDWTHLHFGVFATVFGSLTSYIQAGGRLLRANPAMDHVVIQDHGGNWWRHGSLNSDREWSLEYTDRIAAGMREDRIRNKQDPEPIVCPKCHACRLSGPKCHQCGYQHSGRARMVLQQNGTLKPVNGDIFRKRRELPDNVQARSEWIGRVKAVSKSKKPTVMNMTFAQLQANFARDHQWQYPPRDFPFTPVRDVDWFRPIKDVKELKS